MMCKTEKNIPKNGAFKKAFICQKSRFSNIKYIVFIKKKWSKSIVMQWCVKLSNINDQIHGVHKEKNEVNLL